jgi:predicted small secreted protein
MKNFVILGIAVFALVFSISCGEKQTEEPMKMKMNSEETQMPSDQAWIRTEPVDVKAVDANKDGYVYQDPMDWNVISDEEGKCPKCGMTLKKVTIEEAIKNLKDHGISIKE